MVISVGRRERAGKGESAKTSFFVKPARFPFLLDLAFAVDHQASPNLKPFRGAFSHSFLSLFTDFGKELLTVNSQNTEATSPSSFNYTHYHLIFTKKKSGRLLIENSLPLGGFNVCGFSGEDDKSTLQHYVKKPPELIDFLFNGLCLDTVLICQVRILPFFFNIVCEPPLGVHPE